MPPSNETIKEHIKKKTVCDERQLICDEVRNVWQSWNFDQNASYDRKKKCIITY